MQHNVVDQTLVCAKCGWWRRFESAQAAPTVSNAVLDEIQHKLYAWRPTRLDAVALIQAWVDARDASKELNVSYAGLMSLPELPGTITKILCKNSRLRSLGACALPSRLLSLDVSHNLLISLGPYSLPVTLRQLTCHDNLLTTLGPLPANLQYLRCDNNKLRTLGRLPDTLTALFCERNALATLSRTPLPPRLRELQCRFNPLRRISDFSLPAALIRLYLPVAVQLPDTYASALYTVVYDNNHHPGSTPWPCIWKARVAAAHTADRRHVVTLLPSAALLYV